MKAGEGWDSVLRTHLCWFFAQDISKRFGRLLWAVTAFGLHRGNAPRLSLEQRKKGPIHFYFPHSHHSFLEGRKRSCCLLLAKAFGLQSLVFIALVVDNRDHVHKSCHRRKMQIHPIAFEERHQQCWDLSTRAEHWISSTNNPTTTLFLQWEEIWRGSFFLFSFRHLS